MTALTMTRGDDATFAVAAVDAAGAPLSLSGTTLRFAARRSEDLPATPFIDKSGPPGLVIDPDQVTNKGKASIVLVPADTLPLESGTVLTWDLQATAGGKVTTLASGTLEVLPDVTTTGTPTTEGWLLTPSILRQFGPTTLEDAALQVLIEANQGEVERRYGKAGESRTVARRQFRDSPYIYLTPAAGTISAIRESWQDLLTGGIFTTLDSTDYRIFDGGSGLERLVTGTHKADTWGPRVEIDYIPLDQVAQYRLAIVRLCQLDLSSKPGLSSFTVGKHSEVMGRTQPYADERENILASLGGSGAVLA